MLTCTLTAVAAEDETLAWESRAIIGWHQAGASSAESSQHLFFDFYVARPLGGAAEVFGNNVNLWGQVRVASAPQQRNIPLSQFVAGFAQELGKVPVNELAQSAEFLSGFEIRPKKLKWGDSSTQRVRTLGFVGFFGASGAFKDPVTDVRIFRVPSVTSPQWTNFVTQFPEFSDPGFRANASYLGLVPPDRERFYRQYGFGLRYTSYIGAHPDAAPAMFTATAGQDQSITHGRYVGTVIKFDAFYPMPIEKASFLYLFGTANLAAAKPQDRTPLALQLVSQPCDSSTVQGTTCGISASQDNVAIRSVASSRDTYRIGVGIDAISLIKQLMNLK
jgi:hypothetical protein